VVRRALVAGAITALGTFAFLRWGPPAGDAGQAGIVARAGTYALAAGALAAVVGYATR
jgi:hypothetical protein